MYVITGSPGVGKHTVAEMVAKSFHMELVDINTVALRNNAIITRDEISYVVDLRKLARAMKKEITRKKKKKCLVVGHLAPYVLGKRDPGLVVVLRRSPYELKRVYARRGYDQQKATDNITSEIIGVLAFDSLKKFGRERVVEVDSTAKRPKRVAEEILSMIGGRSGKEKGSGRGGGGVTANIDWLSLVAKRGDLRKFFEYGSVVR